MCGRSRQSSISSTNSWSFYSAVRTLWQRQTPLGKATTARPPAGTSLSPTRVGRTFQSGQTDVKLRQLFFLITGPGVCFTDLLQTRAQVAAEHEANPVDFHAMNAGLHVAFLHPLKVSFLSEVQLGTLSDIHSLDIWQHNRNMTTHSKYLLVSH